MLSITHGAIVLPPSPVRVQQTCHSHGHWRAVEGMSHKKSFLHASGMAAVVAIAGRKCRRLRRTISVQSMSNSCVNSEVAPLRRSFVATIGSTVMSLPQNSASAAVDYSIERAIPQSRLVRDLSKSAPRTVVITGANSGVGLAGAKYLVAAGHRVICACRTEEKADKAVASCLEYAKDMPGTHVAAGYKCDLADLASIKSFVDKLNMEKEKVDTLCLNAGLSLNATEKGSNFVQRTADGFEVTIGTNHLGHFALANLLQPTLAKAAKPRIVITASPVHDPKSGGGEVGPPASLGNLSGLKSANFEMVDGGSFDPDKAYKDSKLCNLLFMAEAVRRFGPDGITVNAFSPGLIADPNGFFRNQNPVFANVFNQISRTVGVAETNEFGGGALAYLAVDSEMNAAQGGWYDSYPNGKHQLALHAPSDEAQRLDEQELLWKLSSELTASCYTKRGIATSTA